MQNGSGDGGVSTKKDEGAKPNQRNHGKLACFYVVRLGPVLCPSLTYFLSSSPVAFFHACVRVPHASGVVCLQQPVSLNTRLLWCKVGETVEVSPCGVDCFRDTREY